MPYKTGSLGQIRSRFGNRTKQSNGQPQLLRHDADGLQQVCIVRENRSHVEVPFTRVPDQMAGKIHIASLFFGFSFAIPSGMVIFWQN